MLTDVSQGRVRRSWPWLVWLAAATLLLVLAASLSRSSLDRQPQSGWQRVSAAGSPAGFAGAVDTGHVERLARERNGEPFAAQWRAYLIAPEAGDYRFAVYTNGDADLIVAGRAAASTGSRGTAWPVHLARGLNEIVLSYQHRGEPARLDIVWARDDGPLRAIDTLLLVPDLLPGDEVRGRLRAAALMPWLPVAGVILLASGLARALRRVALRPLRELEPTERRWLWAVLGAAAVLFAAGATWGTGVIGSWAPDEVTPSEVLDAYSRRFGGGWATIYPPLHYVVLAAVFLPFQLAAGAGLSEAGSLPAWSQMLVTARLVSTAMAVGSLGLVHLIAREEFGPRAARFAVMAAGVVLPLTYYAKTANLDTPYVFWLMLALLFYMRHYRSGRPHDLVGVALAGAASIATKDQAYGFFVLPAVWMTVAALRHHGKPVRPPGVPTLGALSLAGAAGIAALLIFFNVPFNPDGFVEHVRLIRGPASENYRMFDRSIAGYAALVWTAFVQMGLAMSWPVYLAAGAGVVTALVTGAAAPRRLLLPVVSYLVLFIAVVMYHYDRFFIGVALVLAIVAGWWLDRWTAPGVASRGARLAVVSVSLVYALVRCVALDVLMLDDSRYAAERALQAQAHPTRALAAFGRPEYLPRQAFAPYRLIRQDFDAVRALDPEIIVANAAFSRRESPRRAVYESLEAGGLDYNLSARYRTMPWWSPLRFETRFTQLAEDQFSNLTKVNPPIDVFMRRQASERQRP